MAVVIADHGVIGWPRRTCEVVAVGQERPAFLIAGSPAVAVLITYYPYHCDRRPIATIEGMAGGCE
jgi:hypothetical protein